MRWYRRLQYKQSTKPSSQTLKYVQWKFHAFGSTEIRIYNKIHYILELLLNIIVKWINKNNKN